jgi:hypothetical protein
LIGNNNECTVYQIKDHSITNQFGAVRLGSAAIAAGLPQTVDEFNLISDFKQFVIDNEYALDIYENGEDVVNSVESSATDFLSFSLEAQTGAATIDTDAHTIAIEVEAETVVTALVATFTLSYNATAKVSTTAQVSGTTANNFTSAVTYTITADDGETTQDWEVTVTVAS